MGLLLPHAPLTVMTLIAEGLVAIPDRVTRWHPVRAVGALIDWTDNRWNRPDRDSRARRLSGVALALLLVGLGIGLGALFAHYLPIWLQLPVAMLGLAQRSLNDHVRAVAVTIRTDTVAAQQALSKIVGRDTHLLDERGMAAAAIETLAESFCDGVVAPAFWLLVGGLPGLFAFKAISTADSMVGHKDARHRDFGWASARLDDALNWLPARIAAGLLCAAEWRGWRILRRDRKRHLSPNAGWPESAMAGALGVTLGGGAAYDGEWIARDRLGDGPPPRADDLDRALRIYWRACALLWLTAWLLAWLP